MHGGAFGGGGAARDRPRASAGAVRGHPPLGDPPAPADRRGRSPRLPGLPRRDADRGVHHAPVGDRPDPLAPPRPRGDGRRGRRAESPRDRRTVWTGRHATTHRSPPDSLRLTPTPRSRAGTFGERVRPTGASDRSPLRPGAHGARRPDIHRGAAAGGGQAAARPSALAWSAMRRASGGFSTDPD